MEFESQIRKSVEEFNQECDKLNNSNKNKETDVASKLGLRY